LFCGRLRASGHHQDKGEGNGGEVQSIFRHVILLQQKIGVTIRSFLSIVMQCSPDFADSGAINPLNNRKLNARVTNGNLSKKSCFHNNLADLFVQNSAKFCGSLADFAQKRLK